MADHVMFTFDGDVGKPSVWAELPEMEDTLLLVACG